METPFVELKAISKRFAGVKALDGVSLSFFAGAVHAIMGENGAGKSTLMKILSGAQPPDGGEIRISGRTEVIDNPIRARELGIGMVYQELSLLDNLDVARNLLLGREPLCGRKLIDRRRLYRRAGEIIEDLSLDIDPRSMVEDLSIGRKQMVEIARIVASNSRLIIMDEPTSSLGRREEELLFAFGSAVQRSFMSLTEWPRCSPSRIGSAYCGTAVMFSPRQPIGSIATV